MEYVVCCGVLGLRATFFFFFASVLLGWWVGLGYLAGCGVAGG